MTKDTFTKSEVWGLLAACGLTLKIDPEKGLVLEDHDVSGLGSRGVLVKRYGVDVWVVLHPIPGQDKMVAGFEFGILSCRVVLGFLPKVGLAAVFRKLLTMNAVMSRARFALSEQDNSICLVKFVQLAVRKDGTLYQEDFPPILDAVVAEYHEHGPQLIKEFGLLQQPA